MTLPARLGDAARALGLTQQKMDGGKDLIRYFSMPCKPTKVNGGRTRNLPAHAPDKWAIYKAYNAQDVETERALRKSLEKYPLPEHKWALYALDQRINDRGVRVDRLLVKQAEVDQIWAEALCLYRKGERLFLEGADAQAAQDSQRDALETDEREGLVHAYLERLLPEGWDEMDLYERRNFLNGSEFGGTAHTGTVQRRRVCNMEIWCECLGKDAATIKKSDSYEIAAIVRRLGGWGKPINGPERQPFPIYGQQRAYVRYADRQE